MMPLNMWAFSSRYVTLQKDQVSGGQMSLMPFIYSAIAEKRNKRPRAPSPSGTPVPAQLVSGNGRSVSITLPPRTNSVGPTSSLRDSRAKKDSLLAKQQQSLQQGRKVVFRPPKSADAEEGTWIVAVITRVINSGKDGGKYEVQDVEPQEDGQPGA
jgi:SAGA-associated factor 29